MVKWFNWMHLKHFTMYLLWLPFIIIKGCFEFWGEHWVTFKNDLTFSLHSSTPPLLHSWRHFRPWTQTTFDRSSGTWFSSLEIRPLENNSWGSRCKSVKTLKIIPSIFYSMPKKANSAWRRRPPKAPPSLNHNPSLPITNLDIYKLLKME